MWLKAKRTPEERKKAFTYLGGAAQIALVAAILLGRLDQPGLDFIAGALLGFSLVGNLTFLVGYSRNSFGGRHD